MVCLVVSPRSVEKRVKGYIVCLFQLDDELGILNIIMKDCLTFFTVMLAFIEQFLSCRIPEVR